MSPSFMDTNPHTIPKSPPHLSLTCSQTVKLTDTPYGTQTPFHIEPSMWIKPSHTTPPSPYSSFSSDSNASQSSLFDSIGSPLSDDSLPPSPSADISFFAPKDNAIDGTCLTDWELRSVHHSDALAALEDRRCDIQFPWEAPTWLEWLQAAAENDRPFLAFGNCRRKRLSPICPSIISEDDGNDDSAQEEAPIQSEEEAIEQQQRIKELHDTLVIKTVATVDYDDFVNRVNSIPLAREPSRFRKNLPLEPETTPISTSSVLNHRSGSTLPVSPNKCTPSRSYYLPNRNGPATVYEDRDFNALGLFVPQQNIRNSTSNPSRHSLRRRKAVSRRSSLRSVTSVPNFSKEPLAPVPELPQTIQSQVTIESSATEAPTEQGLQPAKETPDPVMTSTWSDSTVSTLGANEPPTLFKRVGSSMGDIFKSFTRPN